MTNCVSYFDMFQCLSTYDTVYKVGPGYPLHAGKVLKIFKTGNTVEMYMIYTLVNFLQKWILMFLAVFSPKIMLFHNCIIRNEKLHK